MNTSYLNKVEKPKMKVQKIQKDMHQVIMKLKIVLKKEKNNNRRRLERGKKKISFRQLSQFKSTTELVAFILYILVSDQINKGLEIKLFGFFN